MMLRAAVATRGASRHPTSLATRALRLARLVAQMTYVYVAARWFLPRIAGRGRERRLRRWARRMLGILNVRVVVTGTIPAPGRPVLVVANHISWLDIQALSSVKGARFVAKSEVRDWPVIGKTAERMGTFFIVRNRCRSAWRTMREIADALRNKEPVAVFPEGTTSEGREVLRFYPAMFQAAIDAGVSVYPVTIRYRDLNGADNHAAAFVGDMTFAESLRRVLREHAMVVELRFGMPLVSSNTTRRALAAQAQQMIAATLALAPRRPVLEALGEMDGPSAPGDYATPGLRPPAQLPAV
jgi:1-acyl-sn-glycerol-3-phosphate acyltransferase